MRVGSGDVGSSSSPILLYRQASGKHIQGQTKDLGKGRRWWPYMEGVMLQKGVGEKTGGRNVKGPTMRALQKTILDDDVAPCDWWDGKVVASLEGLCRNRGAANVTLHYVVVVVVVVAVASRFQTCELYRDWTTSSGSGRMTVCLITSHAQTPGLCTDWIKGGDWPRETIRLLATRDGACGLCCDWTMGSDSAMGIISSHATRGRKWGLPPDWTPGSDWVMGTVR
mmetsp:Transcript_10223/g.17362  ORF Transcript_10223/g.17362 Transcript_10223/m.17362 type:complete len:225 (+) Transcript_10223:103-777(+)